MLMTEQPDELKADVLVRFAIIFVKRGFLGPDRIVYLVQGATPPGRWSAVGNVTRIDEKTRSYVDPAEVIPIETGDLTALFRKVQRVLSDRHEGYSMTITFDFDFAW
jgi:hypothetical protein